MCVRPVPSQKKSVKQKISLKKVVRCTSSVTRIHSESCCCHCSAGKGKANPSPASCIQSHYRVSSGSLILMSSQTTTSEVKPRYVYSTLEPLGQYSKILVIPLPRKAKPSSVYSILKPHDQSCRNPVRPLLHCLLTITYNQKPMFQFHHLLRVGPKQLCALHT